MNLHVFDVRDVFVEVFRQQYETDMLRPEAIANPNCLALGFREEFTCGNHDTFHPAPWRSAT
ncbi:hypothetical protein NEUTE2DRAFT_66196 [Neurospora tetrasperma FGSC 2509]|nr:hypothetical protein NEUTE2DRAFT_66196 [Neurospora tetrasperma FGSC 2509]